MADPRDTDGKSTPDVDPNPEDVTWLEPSHLAIPAWRQRIYNRLEDAGRFRSAVLFTALAGMFATSFPITILTIALAPIADEFDAPETTLAWVISAPMLLSACFFPLLGKLGDLRGHRQVFLAGFTGATLVAALTAFAWDEYSLIGFRTLAAILGGATQPTSMALIFSVYPPEERVRAMGWWSMTTAAAPALGVAVGGPLVDLVGWRIVFLLQAGLSLGALALAFAVLRETAPKRVRFDFAGSIALALGIGGLMFALGSLRSKNVSALLVGSSVAVGILSLILFVAIEKRVKDPLLPLAFFRARCAARGAFLQGIMLCHRVRHVLFERRRPSTQLPALQTRGRTNCLHGLGLRSLQLCTQLGSLALELRDVRSGTSLRSAQFLHLLGQHVRRHHVCAAAAAAAAAAQSGEVWTTAGREPAGQQGERCATGVCRRPTHIHVRPDGRASLGRRPRSAARGGTLAPVRWRASPP